jgi:hypothetical protein
MQEVYFSTVPPLSENGKQDHREKPSFDRSSVALRAVLENSSDIIKEKIARISEKYIEHSSAFIILPHSPPLYEICSYHSYCWICNLNAVYRSNLRELEESLQKFIT